MYISKKHLTVLVLVLIATLLVAFSPNLEALNGYFVCKSRNVDTEDCLTIWNGGGISIYKNPGNTAVFTVDGENGNTDVGGTLTVDGASTFTGNQTFTGAPTFNGGAIFRTASPSFEISPIMASESITPTDGAAITITANLVTLTPAGATGNSLAACTTGKWAVLYNSVNANVVITDTGNFIGAGDQTLGQYDALQLVCIGTKWVQVSALSAN